MIALDVKMQCMNIYIKAFPEPDFSFGQRLFEECFKYIVYKENKGEVVSLFFALPCIFSDNREDKECVYIFAAATEPNHRGKGYMTELLYDFCKDTDKPVFLRPATEKLINYYAKFGFKTAIGVNLLSGNPKIKPIESYEILAEQFPDTDCGEYTLMFKNIDIKNKIYFPYTMN